MPDVNSPYKINVPVVKVAIRLHEISKGPQLCIKIFNQLAFRFLWKIGTHFPFIFNLSMYEVPILELISKASFLVFPRVLKVRFGIYLHNLQVDLL
jgi:hypothetical protein